VRKKRDALSECGKDGICHIMRNHENGVQDLANLSHEQSILRKGARIVGSKEFLLRKVHVNARNYVATMRMDTQRRGTHPNYFGLGCDRPHAPWVV
jgi:hypothetical protein